MGFELTIAKEDRGLEPQTTQLSAPQSLSKRCRFASPVYLPKFSL